MQNNYQNRTILIDQSFNEPACYIKNDCGVDIYDFLAENAGCSFMATPQSLGELVGYYPDNTRNLFNGFVSDQVTSGQQSANLIISKTDGTVTSGAFEEGYPLKIESVNLEPSKTPLWDAYSPFKKAAKSSADKSNIYYAREHSDCWVATNDKNQIRAIELSGGHCLRPAAVLVWMVQDKFIANQKAVWTFIRMKKKDGGWVPKNTSFANYSVKNIFLFQ